MILIDIGNSRIKWGTADGENVRMLDAIDHGNQDFIGLIQRQWERLPKPGKVIISTVAADVIFLEIEHLISKIWPNTVLIKPVTQANAFGVINSYQNASKLGVDRWLALLALKKFYPECLACVIDCGTAITLDFIDGQGNHLGGIISPGIQLMKQSLLENTAALTLDGDEHFAGLATNTQAAIESGALNAAAGLIERCVKKQPDLEKIILTGGDAQLLSCFLDLDFIVENELILKGLAIYGQEAHG